ncbi:MAG TPA: hypothetical protein PLD18_05470 [Flavobacterium sp.]|nr:hypothetical protein [Flavobacterium sp.]
MSDFKKKYYQSIIDEEIRQLSENKGLIDSFKKFVSKYDIKLEDENFRYYETIGIIATYPNLITNFNSSLIPDKEGLMDLNLLSEIFEKKRFANGYLFSEKFMLMANSYFRRGFHYSNNFEPRFIEFYWNLNLPNSKTYISLDLDRVRINVDNSMCLERDTWYGAKFNKTIKNIKDDVVKLRPPLDLDDFDISFFFSDSYAFDIKWYTKDNIKTFQAEEFKTEKIKIEKDGIKYFPVRYIHAEFDLDKNHFRHFDGAIHFYTESEYLSRRDSDFNYNSKTDSHIKTKSKKLFKINGEISIETWIEYTSHFFSKNSLVFEYFEGNYPKHIINFLEKVNEIKAKQ